MTRVVLDANVLVSALLAAGSPPARIIELWRAGRFELLTCEEQLDELGRVTRYPKLRQRLTASVAGRLVNDIRAVATVVTQLPEITVCTDPADNHLLATAQAGRADYLVSGDKRHVLTLERYLSTRILGVADFLTVIERSRQT